MTRLLMPVVIIAIAVTVFFMFTNPFLTELTDIKSQIASYNAALDHEKALEKVRDNLTDKYNKILPTDLDRLAKLLPDNVNNIRLILEIEQIALPYGMGLKDIKYNVPASTSSAQGASQGIGGLGESSEYGSFDLEFSVTGSYFNFINFTKDLEKNLRIVDVSSITFNSPDSNDTTVKNATPPDVYNYQFKIKTYWLKN